ncbi:MAG: hypothetical protein K2Y04_09750 [Caulobacteraceae bacterium]|nr:hypothetical protein [Caulobacteraceae bacterium]
MRFLTGFAFATVVLGFLLVVAWCAAAAVAALGGPDINLPGQLVRSGATMLVIGGAIYTLIKSQERSKAADPNKHESV